MFPSTALVGLALVAGQLASASPIASGLDTRDMLRLQRRATANTTAPADFVLEQHLGNLSPYFVPVSNYSLELPESCTVTQASLMQRHGSRFPLASENAYSTNVSALFQSAEGQRLLANFTGELEFLKTWTNRLGHDDLTAPGRQQLFEHGVAVNLSYPHLSTSEMLVGDQDRVCVPPLARPSDAARAPVLTSSTPPFCASPGLSRRSGSGWATTAATGPTSRPST